MTEEYELEVMVSIRQGSTGGFLEIRERVSVDAGGFMQIAGILGKFHDLAQALKSPEGRK